MIHWCRFVSKEQSSLFNVAKGVSSHSYIFVACFPVAVVSGTLGVLLPCHEDGLEDLEIVTVLTFCR